MVRNIKKNKIKTDWATRLWRDAVDCADSNLIATSTYQGDLEAELYSPKDNEFGVYLGTSQLLSYSTAGVAIQCFDQSRIAEGWQLIAESLMWMLADLKISSALGFPNPSSYFLNNAALLYCSSIALKSRHVFDWTARFIINTEADKKSKMRPVEPNEFDLLCYQLASETCSVESKPEWCENLDESMYGPILRASTPQEVQDAISELTINRAVLCSETLMGDLAPFEFSPFNLFPMDILAILRMRHSNLTGFDFGCMESPLCHPPTELNWEKPEILLRVENRVRELYALPDVDWK